MYASDLRHSSARLEEKLAYIYKLGTKTINLAFRPEFLQLLAAFDNPHQKLPPVIHVAGTNGKGSTVAMLRAMLEAQGYKVHVYTSPHLIEFNERIRLAGEFIGNDFLESLIDEALEKNGSNDITFFELTTTIAFAAFARVPADICILEVGMGGRMDCTNIVEQPLVSIITSIAMDHMEFLGDTLEKIAAEKGGIIKPGVPVILAQQSKDSEKSVTKTIAEIAFQRGAPLSRGGSDWRTNDDGAVFNFVNDSVEMSLTRPSLQGTHQIANAGTAIAALRIIKDQFPVSHEAIETGLQNIDWPARLQNVTRRIGKIPSGWNVFLDGGHNNDAAHALAAWAESEKTKLHLILAMMNRKDAAGFAGILQKHLASITCADIPGEPKAYKPAELQQMLQVALPGLPVHATPDVYDAIRSITSQNQPGRILIAGSLYLAGHILRGS